MFNFRLCSFVLSLVALCVSVEAKKKMTWQQGDEALSVKVQAVEENAAKNLAEATKDLTAQLESMQARLTKEIESVAAQVQDVQDNLNNFVKKDGSQS